MNSNSPAAYKRTLPNMPVVPHVTRPDIPSLKLRVRQNDIATTKMRKPLVWSSPTHYSGTNLREETVIISR